MSTATATHPTESIRPVDFGERCLNCESLLQGPPCHACGQRSLDGRLTLRLFLTEAVRHLTFEQGFLGTVVGMTRQPGRVIRSYINGRRRRYVHPIRYMILCAALSLLLFPLQRDEVVAYMDTVSAEMSADEHPFMTPTQAQAYTDLSLRASQWTSLTGLLMCIPFALFLRLFFRRSGINLAEWLVFALFTVAHVFVLNSAVTLLLMPFENSVPYMLIASTLLNVYVAAHAAAGFYGRPVVSAVKATIAMILAYSFAVLVITVGLMVYVFGTVA